MRRTAALIVGGGPAGSAAAIGLARAGAEPMLIERTSGPHDKVCGGFLGWDALAALRRLGVEPATLGARPITRLRLVSSGFEREVQLPAPAAGLSRRVLDEAMLAAAVKAGAEVIRGRSAKSADPATRGVRFDDGDEIAADALLLATGKHELRGLTRSASIGTAPLGLRTALGPSRELDHALEGVIELHLFDGGYLGLLLQEDGCTNLCLSVSLARFKQAGSIEELTKDLTRALPLLRRRLACSPSLGWSAVSGVPYGWRARSTSPGLFRIGDQSAVIASLAGDGMAIALESGTDAARAVTTGLDAGTYQRGFAARARRPVAVAEGLRWAAERPFPRAALMRLIGWIPRLAPTAARLTRIGG